jgi:hypothetical protein
MKRVMIPRKEEYQGRKEGRKEWDREGREEGRISRKDKY